MINEVTSRKCRDCDTILSCIPRIVRCFDCHIKHIDNALISNQNNSNHKKMIISLILIYISNMSYNIEYYVDDIIKSYDPDSVNDITDIIHERRDNHVSYSSNVENIQII